MFNPLLAKLFLQLQYLFVDQIEQLGIAWLDHLCRGLTLQTRWTTAYARHFHALIFSNDGAQRTTVANFNRFGVTWRCQRRKRYHWSRHCQHKELPSCGAMPHRYKRRYPLYHHRYRRRRHPVHVHLPSILNNLMPVRQNISWSTFAHNVQTALTMFSPCRCDM